MGKYYEELEPGQIYRHQVTRTVTEVDNLMFTALSHNDQPLHLDEEFGKKSIYGSRVCSSLYTLAFTNGVAVRTLTLGTLIGNLGYENIKFPNPVRIGDTLRSESEVIECRESKKHPNAGVVTMEHRGYNQREEVVCIARQVGLMMKRPVAAE